MPRFVCRMRVDLPDRFFGLKSFSFGFSVDLLDAPTLGIVDVTFLLPSFSQALFSDLEISLCMLRTPSSLKGA